MKPDAFLKALGKWDKDTFIFGFIITLITCALIVISAPAIYFLFATCLYLVAYILMRYALLRVQMVEREHQLRSLPARKARKVVEDNATKSEKAALDKFNRSVKTRAKITDGDSNERGN